MLSENPLIYRWQLQQKRQPRWLKWLSPLLHLGLLASLAFCKGDLSDRPLVLFTLVWTLYLCGRPLLEGVRLLASERQKGTYESLLTTGLQAHQWIGTLFLGLVLPRWLELTLMVLVLGVLQHTTPWESLALWGFLTAAIPFHAAAGLFISARQNQPVKAQLQALSLLIGLFFVSVAVDALLISNSGPTFCQYSSPWLGAYAILCRRWQEKGGLWLSLLAQIGLCMASLWGAQASLARGALTRALPSRRPSRTRLSLAGAGSALFYRGMLTGSRRWLARMVAMVVVLIAFQSDEAHFLGHLENDVLGLALMLLSLYCTVRAALAGSEAVALERENRNWESLLATRMSLPEIFLSVSSMALLPVLLETLVLSGSWSLLATAGNLLVPLYLVLWVGAVGSFALWQSCRRISSAQALGVTAAVTMVATFAGFFAEIFNERSAIAAFSPFYLLSRLAWGNPQDQEWMLSLGFYLMVGLLSLLAAYRQLRRQP